MKKYCLALDLKDDVDKINEYKDYHQDIWPEISKSLKDSGILNAEIYNTGNRLFMIIEVDKTFSFEKKLKMDSENPKVQEWEELMWNYQQALPQSEKGSKWVLMDKIFDLNK
jgi:L-rhamnose mutarotase|tara:strand:- start:173 stop:508 length:336 start_codon:yes stop_codon:yes gene_type:complete